MSGRDPRRACWRLELWPEPDRLAWEALNTQVHFLEAPAMAARWRSPTRLKHLKAWGRYLNWLHSIEALSEADIPEDRITPKRVARYIECLQAQVASAAWALLVAATLVASTAPLTAQVSTHSNKLAGFAAGVTISAAVFSLDDVLGSSCRGSGSYLAICRIGYVGAAVVSGGVGALVGSLVKTQGPRGPVTKGMVGSMLGATGAFLVSIVGCSQEDSSNPDFLCGYDGMVTTGSIVGGAVIGGVLGALVGRESGGLQVSQLGIVPRQGSRLGLGVSFTVLRE